MIKKRALIIAGFWLLAAIPTDLVLAAVPSGKIGRLNRAAGTKVIWNTRKARVADITCDGKADLILFGLSGKLVWVGLVPAGKAKPQVIKFPKAYATQDGYSRPPTEISIYPLECESEDGPLEGCRRRKGCKSFSLDSGETDPFNFYWNARDQRLEW